MRLQAKEKQTIVDLFISVSQDYRKLWGLRYFIIYLGYLNEDVTSLPIRDILNRLKRYLFFSVPANGFIYAN